MRRKFESLEKHFGRGAIDYGRVYDFFEGWMAYARSANTYKLRRKLAKEIERNFPNEISTKEINRVYKS